MDQETPYSYYEMVDEWRNPHRQWIESRGIEDSHQGPHVSRPAATEYHVGDGTLHGKRQRDAQAQQLRGSDLQDVCSGPHVSRPATGGYHVSDGTIQKGTQYGYSPGCRDYTSGGRSCVGDGLLDSNPRAARWHYREEEHGTDIHWE